MAQEHLRIITSAKVLLLAARESRVLRMLVFA
jgi:hypothetical protein